MLALGRVRIKLHGRLTLGHTGPPSEGQPMPLVTIRWFPGRTEAQKQDVVTRITQAFQDAVGSPPEHVSIIFEEVARADWYEAGRPAGQTPAG